MIELSVCFVCHDAATPPRTTKGMFDNSLYFGKLLYRCGVCVKFVPVLVFTVARSVA